jgi:hypothetical protein
MSIITQGELAVHQPPTLECVGCRTAPRCSLLSVPFHWSHAVPKSRNGTTDAHDISGREVMGRSHISHYYSPPMLSAPNAPQPPITLSSTSGLAQAATRLKDRYDSGLEACAPHNAGKSEWQTSDGCLLPYRVPFRTPR